MIDRPGWTAAVLAWGVALAMLVWDRRRGAGSRPQGRGRQGRQGFPQERNLRLSPVRLARPAALAAGAALAFTFHPVAGLAGGAAAWWLLPAVAARLETGEQADRRQALASQLPLAAGLLSSCLAAGAALLPALDATAEALQEPARDVLRRAAATVALGGGPTELAAVLSAGGDPDWQVLAAAVVRSSRTGAPLADLLLDAAEQAQRSWAAAASVRARSAAVRTVLPLALCYLPSFLLLGIAPIVAGLLAGMDIL